MSKKEYRAKMRAEYGANWWKKSARAKTRGSVKEDWSGWPESWGFWFGSEVSKDGKALCYHGADEESGYSGDSYSLCVERVGKKYRLTLFFMEGYGGGGSEHPDDDIEIGLGTHDKEQAIWTIAHKAQEDYVGRVIGKALERRYAR